MALVMPCIVFTAVFPSLNGAMSQVPSRWLAPESTDAISAASTASKLRTHGLTNPEPVKVLSPRVAGKDGPGGTCLAPVEQACRGLHGGFL